MKPTAVHCWYMIACNKGCCCAEFASCTGRRGLSESPRLLVNIFSLPYCSSDCTPALAKGGCRAKVELCLGKTGHFGQNEHSSFCVPIGIQKTKQLK